MVAVLTEMLKMSERTSSSWSAYSLCFFPEMLSDSTAFRGFHGSAYMLGRHIRLGVVVLQVKALHGFTQQYICNFFVIHGFGKQNNSLFPIMFISHCHLLCEGLREYINYFLLLNDLFSTAVCTSYAIYCSAFWQLFSENKNTYFQHKNHIPFVTHGRGIIMV